MKIVQPEKLRREGLVLRRPILVLGLRAAPQLARSRPENNVAFALTNYGRIALGQPLDQLLIGQISDFRDQSAASLLIALIDKRAFCRGQISQLFQRLDGDFLARRTASPYLVGPHGYYLRDRASRKPLVWDAAAGEARPYDTPGIDGALAARVEVDAVEVGADDEVLADGRLAGDTAFARLVAHMREYTPEWAAGVCDVPAATIRASFIEAEPRRAPSTGACECLRIRRSTSARRGRRAPAPLQ